MGSGKSTVSEIIQNAGFAVFSCDKIYKELLSRGVFDVDLMNAFGGGIFVEGKLDKAKLSDKVFNDRQALEKLNEITHPVIMKEALNCIKDEKIGFIEVPLLFENGFEKFFDKVLVVLRNRDIRIDSIVKRDKITQNEAILRLKAQYDYDNSDFTKYYVIHNDGNFNDLSISVGTVLKKITENF